MAKLSPPFVIEAALLSASKPVSLRDLRRLFNDKLSAKTVREHLEELRAFWSGRGLRLVEAADGWRFQTTEETGTYLKRLEPERERRYSRAAMETLAVIAYRQPVTRGDIEAVRGVAVNPAILKQFEERGWIEVIGRRETPGRPELLATTKQFLSDLGLKSVADLPAVEAVPEPEFELGLRDETGDAPPSEAAPKESDCEEDR